MNYEAVESLAVGPYEIVERVETEDAIGTVFIDGSEITAKDGARLLVVPGLPAGQASPLSAQEAISDAKSQGKLAFITYPEGRALAEIAR